ncbi:hypothetical protein HD806DRAFT_493788 [Xylariaceae sp. AK1471]|nr:hypothetical protein HD806DRAFT_493788 [Xylariaceae sp. AK1471]
MVPKGHVRGLVIHAMIVLTDGSALPPKRQHNRLPVGLAGHARTVKAAGSVLPCKLPGHVRVLLCLLLVLLALLLPSPVLRLLHQCQENLGQASQFPLLLRKSQVGAIAAAGQINETRGPSAQRLLIWASLQMKHVYNIAWARVFSWRVQKMATVVFVETF